jgi:hypothetical protein
MGGMFNNVPCIRSVDHPTHYGVRHVPRTINRSLYFCDLVATSCGSIHPSEDQRNDAAWKMATGSWFVARAAAPRFQRV